MNLVFPEAFVVADQASVDAQKRFISSTRFQLLLMVVASAAGALSWTIRGDWDGTALIAGAAFTAAAGLRILLLKWGPHKIWYDGRAAAESIKTLAWKHAVAGDPFTKNDTDADQRFVQLARDVVSGFDSLDVKIRHASTEPTAEMRAARELPLVERRRLYADDRIGDQQRWYGAKAAWNQRRARLWGTTVLSLQVAGAVGAFLKGFGLVDIDIFGLAGAAVAAAAAWLETKQHHTIARAYLVAAEELGTIQSLVDQQANEEEWARFVAEAEEAISREHTMWKASTRSRQPVSLA